MWKWSIHIFTCKLYNCHVCSSMILRYFLHEWTGWFWHNECKQKENVKKVKINILKICRCIGWFRCRKCSKRCRQKCWTRPRQCQCGNLEWRIRCVSQVNNTSKFYQRKNFEENCVGFIWNRQQAKLFEERMSNVFGGVEGAPSGDQINLTFQKMAGMIPIIIYDVKFNIFHSKWQRWPDYIVLHLLLL